MHAKTKPLRHASIRWFGLYIRAVVHNHFEDVSFHYSLTKCIVKSLDVPRCPFQLPSNMMWPPSKSIQCLWKSCRGYLTTKLLESKYRFGGFRTLSDKHVSIDRFLTFKNEWLFQWSVFWLAKTSDCFNGLFSGFQKRVTVSMDCFLALENEWLFHWTVFRLRKICYCFTGLFSGLEK